MSQDTALLTTMIVESLSKAGDRRLEEHPADVFNDMLEEVPELRGRRWELVVTRQGRARVRVWTPRHGVLTFRKVSRGWEVVE